MEYGLSMGWRNNRGKKGEAKGGNEAADARDSEETLSPTAAEGRSAVRGTQHHTQARADTQDLRVDGPGALVHPGRG